MVFAVGVDFGGGGAVVLGAGGGAGTAVPTATTWSTAGVVTCSLETLRPTSTPPRVRTSQVTVLTPVRPVMRTVLTPASRAGSSTDVVVKGITTCSEREMVTSSGVGVQVAVVVDEVAAGVVGQAEVDGGEALGPVAEAVATPLNINPRTRAPAPAAPVTAAN